MKYIALPLARIELGKPVPVNVWDAHGTLLIRKGQAITSEHHKEVLQQHGACATEPDFKAWQRAYDRQIYALFSRGASIGEISRSLMPTEILDIDYVVGFDIKGDWLDVHEVLNGLLQQGATARNPLERLEGVQKRATALLNADADECLFRLFQLLPDRSVAYSAKHALLSAALCELTAAKLQVADYVRPVLFQAALVMNIAMARDQDEMARQTIALTAEQRALIQTHPQRSVEVLRGYGVVNEDLLDMVGGHRAQDGFGGQDRNLECCQILSMADQFIAKMSARATRPALSAILAARSMFTEAGASMARIGSAMTTAVGFYPPGTYVTLANGETAVAVRRGPTANAPLVASVIDAKGTTLAQYVGRDTRDRAFAVTSPVSADALKLKVNPEKVEKALSRMGSGD
jgi:HD-GYP domain-containing protein (c-di-GMP phosphodiesterase class II)